MSKSGIDVNVSGFIRGLNLADKKIRDASTHRLRLNGLDLEKEAKNLAPVDEGNLMGGGSAKFTKGKKKKRGRQPSWYPRTSKVKAKYDGFEVVVGFNAPYAAEVHETMFPAIAVTSGRSGGGVSGKSPGETTRNKPPTRFGPAGGKYLERPLLGKMKEYTKFIAKAVKKELAMGRIRARR